MFIDAHWAEDKAHVGNLDWMNRLNRMKKGGEEDVGESLLPNPVHPVHPVNTEPISAPRITGLWGKPTLVEAAAR